MDTPSRGLLGQTARFIALLLGLVLVSVLALGVWHQRWNVMNAVQSTAVVSKGLRSWRCHGVVRPKLVASGDPWEISYSWTGGFGPGSVEVTIRSDGRAVVAHRGNSEPTRTVSEVSIPAANVESIARQVDESGMLCLVTEPRNGYQVADLGKFSFTVVQGAYSKNIYIDGCHTVASARDMFSVIQEIVALKSVLGPEVEWGPYGTSYIPGSCREETAPQMPEGKSASG
jgi:hypothetical protein